MILRDTNSGQVWVFSDEECKDYAYLIACLPSDQLNQREDKFIREMEVKFRKGGGYLTPGQWDWFAGLVARFSSYILHEDDAAAQIRKLARGVL